MQEVSRNNYIVLLCLFNSNFIKLDYFKTLATRALEEYDTQHPPMFECRNCKLYHWNPKVVSEHTVLCIKKYLFCLLL